MVECQQKARNQTTIINWLQKSKELRSGRIIGEGLRDAWAYGCRPTQPDLISGEEDSGKETEEEEFDWEQNIPPNRP